MPCLRTLLGGENMTKKILVLYHANCADGFCAAWIAHRYFGDEAEYLPVQYSEDPPDVTDRHAYILDFSYKRNVTIAMAFKAKRLFILDHHKTAEKELDSISYVHGHPDEGTNIFCKFDISKSGGRLTWEHFYPGQKAPWLVDYTEDRDLWLWKRMESREVNAALASYERTFERWDAFDKLGTPIQTLADEGRAILRYQQQIVDGQCANASEIVLDGHKVLSVNATVLISEIAGQLAKDRPFGATWFQRADGKKVWSLRSRDGGIDVSEIAKAHGGGGHRNAAGFEEKS